VFNGECIDRLVDWGRNVARIANPQLCGSEASCLLPHYYDRVQLQGVQVAKVSDVMSLTTKRQEKCRKIFTCLRAVSGYCSEKRKVCCQHRHQSSISDTAIVIGQPLVLKTFF